MKTLNRQLGAAMILSNEKTMTIAPLLFTLLLTLGLIGAFGPPAALAASTSSDSLYVGDTADNTVKRFDAATGAYLGKFVTQGAQLQGPRGILHVSNGAFLVSNQNAGTPIPGEIDRFDSSGKALGPLVPHTDRNAPFAPRGIILGPRPGTTTVGNSTLFVANTGHDAPDCVGSSQDPCGAVKLYDSTTGTFVQDLDFSSFTALGGEFRPRGVVFGPDGLLYVSVFSEKNLNDGFVLSSNLTGEVKVVARQTTTADACSQHLHRPDGLAFGPDGKLYVTSFRASATDIDRILIFTTAGACSGEIALDEVGKPRAFAQALVFGPGGKLFVPISAPNGPDAGAVRRYDVTDATFPFDNFVAPSASRGPLGAGWYSTFAKTNPHTLAYGP
jgi:WD40 repeat protein